MSAERVNELMDILAAKYGDPPFADIKDMHSQIDATKLGDVPWESFSVTYSGPKPEDPQNVPPWMEAEYEVWFRDPQTVIENQLANPDFKDGIHYAPFREYGPDGKRRWQDLMSGNWAWSQAVNQFYNHRVAPHRQTNFTFRMKSQKIQKLMARCLHQLSLGVIRRLSQWLRGRMSITRCMRHWGMSTTVSVVPSVIL